MRNKILNQAVDVAVMRLPAPLLAGPAVVDSNLKLLAQNFHNQRVGIVRHLGIGNVLLDGQLELFGRDSWF